MSVPSKSEVPCPHCGSAGPWYYQAETKQYRCSDCMYPLPAEDVRAMLKEQKESKKAADQRERDKRAAEVRTKPVEQPAPPVKPEPPKEQPKQQEQYRSPSKPAIRSK